MQPMTLPADTVAAVTAITAATTTTPTATVADVAVCCYYGKRSALATVHFRP